MQIQSEDEESVKVGFNVLIKMNSMQVKNVSTSYSSIFQHAHPLNLAAVHVFCELDKRSTFVRFFASFAIQFLNILGKLIFRLCVLHTNPSPEARLEIVLRLGMTEDDVPPSLGGKPRADRERK